MNTWNAVDVCGAASAIVVGSVMLWAGAAKAARPAATTSAFRDLGIRPPQVAARLVPLVELGIALGAFIRPAAGAAAGAVLLTGFTVFLGAHLRNGSQVSCGCFGSADPSPVTWVTMARNAGLIALALGAAAAAPARLTGPAFKDLVAVVAAAVIAATVGALIIGMLTMKQTIGSVFSQTNKSRLPVSP